MASRFNTLYLGEPGHAAEELDRDHDVNYQVTPNDLRIALINEQQRDVRDAARDAAIEAYWQAKQGEDYGTY